MVMIDWSFIAAELARLAADARPGRLLSVSLPLPRWPETRWLDSSVAWHRPEKSIRLLGTGTAFVATSSGTSRFAALHAAQQGLLQNWRDNTLGRPFAFTGFAFSPKGGEPLPNARLWVPRLLLSAMDGKVTLTCSTPAEHAATALLRWQETWDAWCKPQTSPAPSFAVKDNPLATEAFLSRGRAALRAIKAGSFGKLVLTRSVDLVSDAPIDPMPVLDALAAQHPNCATFCASLAGQAFIGSSPETLLALTGQQVCVDALAGTAWQTSTQEHTKTLFSDKNRREHDFVAETITDRLGGCCHDIALPDAPEVMHLGGLSHLHRRVSARRGLDVSAFDLIARLHPTPAAGGVPTATAIDWLHQHGDHRGAWYTGGMGWLDRHGDADIAVALRCGLIQANTVRLYAGAGFVAGSDPEQELAETEAKFSTLREALRLHSSRSRAAA